MSHALNKHRKKTCLFRTRQLNYKLLVYHSDLSKKIGEGGGGGRVLFLFVSMTTIHNKPQKHEKPQRMGKVWSSLPELKSKKTSDMVLESGMEHPYQGFKMVAPHLT